MEVWESNTYEGYPALAKMYAGLPYVGEWGEDVQMRGCQHIEAVSWPCPYYCLWKRKIRSSQSLNLLQTSLLWIKSESETGSSNIVVSQSVHHCASAWTMFTLWGSRSGIPAWILRTSISSSTRTGRLSSVAPWPWRGWRVSSSPEWWAGTPWSPCHGCPPSLPHRWPAASRGFLLYQTSWNILQQPTWSAI